MLSLRLLLEILNYADPTMMQLRLFFILCSLMGAVILAAQEGEVEQEPYLLLLGVAQDGGYPHIGCDRLCCQPAWENDSLRRFVVSAALVDPVARKWWLLEATPDIKDQLHLFHELTEGQYPDLPAGILVTHAHIGHYTGLMQLGKEALNSKNVPVYAMPRMKLFLATNGPWSQLVGLENIRLEELRADSATSLGEGISVTPLLVPHRDEFSETVGFRLKAGKRSFLFLPDIDKWYKWERELAEEVKQVDLAFLDGTFYYQNELPYRNVQSIPHPMVIETVDYFKPYEADLRKKVVFIHFNHTNPLIWVPAVRQKVEREGFQVGEQGRHY